MKLNLKNPIVFFDLETTGTNINTDRIVEICYLKVSVSYTHLDVYKRQIKKHVPQFEMIYDIDPLKQRIADSWPDSLDDTCAREEWG